MCTTRCTRTLLESVDSAAGLTAPTSLVGDWCANVLYWRLHQLVFCVGERRLVPVVLQAKEAHALAPRLTVALGQVLKGLGIPADLIEREQNEMCAFAYSRTQNRRVLGQLNDLMFQLSWYLRDAPDESLLAHSLRLADTPCGAINGFPDKLTLELFQAAAANAGAHH